MKRILTLIFALLSLQVGAQNTIDHLGKIRMRYNNSGSNDTLLIQFSGDSTYYYSNTNPFHKFKSGLVADSLKLNGGGGWIKTLIPSQWTKRGSNIYYNSGNVGIGNDAPAYTLDVTGLIGGSNIETNTTSLSTKLGYEAGFSEDKTAPRYNVFNGYQSGYFNTTGRYNVFNGYRSGYSNTAGSYNVFNGFQSGYSNTTGTDNVFNGFKSGYSNTTGHDNVFNGFQSGYSNTTGVANVFNGTQSGYFNSSGKFNVFNGAQSGYSNTVGGSNVFNGFNSGHSNTTGMNNIIIGYNSRYYGNSSNELVIDNQQRGTRDADSLLYRNKSLIYGQFDADTLNQFVDINGRLRHTATTAEIYRHIDSTARTQSIPNGTTPTKIVVFSDNGVSSHCTADAANDKITITKPGVYDVKLSISYASGTINVNWFGLLFLNGSVLPNIHSQWNSSASNQFRPTTLSGKIRVTSVPVDLDYRVKHDYGSAVNLTFISANLNVNYIGE